MRRWVNWVTISTTVASLIVVGALTAAFNPVRAEVVEYRTMKREIQTQQQVREQIQQQMKEQTIILRRVAEDTAVMKKDMLTVIGRAVVRDMGEGACLRVNGLSLASKYGSMTRVRITNLTSVEMPSAVMRIEGVFQNSDENWLATLSIHAGRLVDAQSGVSIKVRLEPVE